MSGSSFSVPALADHITEATIVHWLRADGDAVTAGDELVEVETDKATTTLEADADGILHIIAAAGETVRVGVPIATFASAGETPAGPGARIVASPVARRIAGAEGLELQQIDGSGPGGRILKRDVLAAATGTGALREDRPPAAETQAMTRVQQLVARRMEAAGAVPDFAVETEVDMDACRRLRSELAGAEVVPSYNDMVLKAVALALRAHPRANAALRGADEVTHPDEVHLGFAVADEDALVVPTIRDAASRSLGDLARTTRELAARIKAGRIEPRELTGATFTVSNLGMLGVTRFTALVSPPQVAILAVGAIRPQPVVRAGEIGIGHVMTITLCSDHRVVYGADAARLLAHIRATLERPLTMLL